MPEQIFLFKNRSKPVLPHQKKKKKEKKRNKQTKLPNYGVKSGGDRKVKDI